jgi:hypothetical protein
MRHIRTIILFFLCQTLTWQALAQSNTQLEVWANEAIVATYTFDSQNYVAQQKQIALYFTTKGWVDYTNALFKSQLLDSIKKNNYFVSAVATSPPQISSIGTSSQKAVMPILVLYQNPQYQQKQYLTVTIQFSPAPAGQGIRGWLIDSIESKESKPSCRCDGTPSSD